MYHYDTGITECVTSSLSATQIRKYIITAVEEMIACINNIWPYTRCHERHRPDENSLGSQMRTLRRANHRNRRCIPMREAKKNKNRTRNDHHSGSHSESEDQVLVARIPRTANQSQHVKIKLQRNSHRNHMTRSYPQTSATVARTPQHLSKTT